MTANMAVSQTTWISQYSSFFLHLFQKRTIYWR